jgi:hypothetical protein
MGPSRGRRDGHRAAQRDGDKPRRESRHDASDPPPFCAEAMDIVALTHFVLHSLNTGLIAGLKNVELY